MAQTKDIFKKLGANVIHTDVFTYGWKHVIPGNEAHFVDASDKINNYLLYKSDNKDYFKNESLKIDNKNYYFSNVIAKASKTMFDCNSSKLNIKQTGTNG